VGGTLTVTGSASVAFAAGTVSAPSITANGDTNTGIFFPAADTIAFTEGGVEAARFDSSGRFGIGTEANALTNALTVYRTGSTQSAMAAGNSNTGLNGTLFGVDTTGNGIINQTQALPLIFSTSNTERMRLESGGNLAFSSTGQRITGDMTNATLTNRLAFQTSTANGNTTVLALPNGTSTTSQFLAFNTADPTNSSNAALVATSTAVRLSSGQSGTGSYLPLTFFTNGSEQARLDTSGNLGIGTSSPVAKLSVQDASVPKFALQVGSAERAFLSYTESNFTTRLDSDGPLVFAANNAEAGRFDISGNLGIGTSSPGHRLDVVGDAKIRPSSGYNALFEVSGSALRINYLNDALSANVSAAFRAADFVFQTAGATERARITADGNIVAGGSSALATTATNGFLYVPTCAGTPTGTPTAITGMAPIVVNTTNNKLYFYSGGAWRDAGP
jgi:hypothetical protein